MLVIHLMPANTLSNSENSTYRIVSNISSYNEGDEISLNSDVILLDKGFDIVPSPIHIEDKVLVIDTITHKLKWLSLQINDTDLTFSVQMKKILKHFGLLQSVELTLFLITALYNINDCRFLIVMYLLISFISSIYYVYIYGQYITGDKS